jgi:ClpP class serine protease
LVDRLGNFNDAVNEARKQVAKSSAAPEKSPQALPIRYAGAKKSPIEKLVQKLMGQISGLMGDESPLLALAQGLALQNQETALLSALGKDMAWLPDVMGNPHAMGVAAHCLCESSP